MSIIELASSLTDVYRELADWYLELIRQSNWKEAAIIDHYVSLVFDVQMWLYDHC